MRRRFTFLAAAMTAAAVVGLLVASTASAKTTCAGGVFTGVNISGGLIVSGTCVYNDSTISGGVTVTSTGCFELENSKMTTTGVSGGVTVQPGGELDVDHVCASGTATGLSSSISGGIKITNGNDLDLINATVTGGVTINGIGNAPTICGSTFGSGISVQNAAAFGFAIGDPTDFPAFSGYMCPGNTIKGSVYATNDPLIEIEGNSIGGSVAISGSGYDFQGNTVGGSAKCTGSTPTPDGSLDGPNSVKGTNNC